MKVPASGTQTAATYYTYQNDHLGTPQKLLNQSGITVWSATYDGFGKATVDAASTVSNNLRYPGQYYDAETGLHYNWMRYYDPNTGRYVTWDPIGLAGGINFYVYVYGNPSRWMDSNGLAVGSATSLVTGSVMIGPAGGSISVGGVIGTDGTKCLVTQICMRIGFGFYAGVGTSLGGGVSPGGTEDSGGGSVGIGGDVAVGWVGWGGQVSTGGSSAGAGRAGPGVGIGLSAGVDFCYTLSLSCWPLCQL